MAKKVKIGNKPKLTVDSLFERFEKQFGSKYEVYKTKLVGADFVLKKSASSGVAVKLFQKENTTMIRYNAFAPVAWVRLLGSAFIIPIIVLWATSWKDMEKEVQMFIDNTL